MNRRFITDTIFHPLSLLVTWFLFLTSPILSLIRLKYIANKVGGGMHIQGLSSLLFYVPIVLSLFALLILSVWFRSFIEGKATHGHKKAFAFISILSVIFLAISGVLFNLELINYPNYVYSRYGITQPQLQFMSFVTALQVVASLSFYLYSSNYKRTVGKINEIKTVKSGDFFKDFSSEKIAFLLSALGLLSLCILSVPVFFTFPSAVSDAGQKFESRFGTDYKYLLLLIGNTPEEGMIIHPPQGDKWPAIGNQPLIRYFLYPRVLVSGSLMTDDNFAKEIKSGYFVGIDGNENRPYWPEIKEDAGEVVFDEKNSIKYKSLESKAVQGGVIYYIVFNQ
jgi:hypothetical protein